jgi:hypothetical protein
MFYCLFITLKNSREKSFVWSYYCTVKSVAANRLCNLLFSCVLTEDLLSFVASHVSSKIFTITPCNKLLLIPYSVISFQQMEFNTECFPFVLILLLRVPECSCGSLNRKFYRKVMYIYVHVDLSVHMIWFYLCSYLIFIKCMFPVDFFPPLTFSAVFQSMAY